MDHTLTQYKKIVAACRNIFAIKTKDYNTSWQILRLSSCTDQILIKAQRIRNIQEKKKQNVNDSIESEFIGIINYSLIALIQLSLQKIETSKKLTPQETLQYYDQAVATTQSLMLQKNHDYGEIWRDMRTSSLVDIILMKLLRIKQIEDNEGKTNISEGVDSNYQDIINYAIFSLIQLGFPAHKED